MRIKNLTLFPNKFGEIELFLGTPRKLIRKFQNINLSRKHFHFDETRSVGQYHLYIHRNISDEEVTQLFEELMEALDSQPPEVD